MLQRTQRLIAGKQMPSQARKPKGDLAIDGGTSVRSSTLPYGRQSVSESDIASVVAVLRGDWLTTGPHVGEFEDKFSTVVGASHSVAFSSGTAALHAAMFSLGIKPGDEVIVPALSFAASANCILYCGGTPVFCDVTPADLLIDCDEVERKINSRTKAILVVDYAGHPCNYQKLSAIATKHKLPLVADSCHGLGGTDQGKKLGSLADLTAFSFHPVKHITTGEGGMVSTSNPELAKRLKQFRNHGITTEFRERHEKGLLSYDMIELGFNYRLSDIQCALGSSQLSRLPQFLERRRHIAKQYSEKLVGFSGLAPLSVRVGVEHAFHLYVIRLDPSCWSVSRDQFLKALRAEGIGANLHYQPIYWHSYYEKKLGFKRGLCPNSEAAYENILSLPIFADMSDQDVDDVVTALGKLSDAYLL